MALFQGLGQSGTHSTKLCPSITSPQGLGANGTHSRGLWVARLASTAPSSTLSGNRQCLASHIMMLRPQQLVTGSQSRRPWSRWLCVLCFVCVFVRLFYRFHLVIRWIWKLLWINRGWGQFKGSSFSPPTPDFQPGRTCKAALFTQLMVAEYLLSQDCSRCSGYVRAHALLRNACL